MSSNQYSVVSLTETYVFTLLSDCGRSVYFSFKGQRHIISYLPVLSFRLNILSISSPKSIKEVIYGYVDKIDIIIMHSLGKAESSGDYP